VAVTFPAVKSSALKSLKAWDSAYGKQVPLILVLFAAVSTLVAPQREFKNFAFVVNKEQIVTTSAHDRV